MHDRIRKTAEDVSAAVRQAHLIIHDPGFVALLRAGGIESVPRCLVAQPKKKGRRSRLIDRGPARDYSLEFVIVWTFFYPLFSNPSILQYLDVHQSAFIPQMKDAFIALVIDGPLPSQRPAVEVPA
jgi:hypothetical protein